MIKYLILFMFSSVAYSQSHQLINQTRSSFPSLFVSSGMEFSSGRYNLIEPGSNEADLPKGDKVSGVGFKSEIGSEFMKFLKFSAMFNYERSKMQEDSYRRFDSSKLHLNASASFSSPIGNITGAATAFVSDSEMTRLMEYGHYYGKGHSFSLGFEYFLTPRISFNCYLRSEKEKRTKTRGNSTNDNLLIKNDIFGIGSSIWL